MATLPHDAFDRSLKRFWDLDPRPLLRLAFEVDNQAPIQAHPVELVETLRQIADRLVEVSGPHGPFLAHAEFERQPKADLPHRMFSYNALLWTAQQYRLPVLSVVFLLEVPPEGFSTQVSSRYGTTAVQQFTFRAVHLYSMTAQTLAQTPGLAPLAPLGKDCTLEQIQRAVQTVIQHPEGNPANQLAVLYLLGRVKGLTESLLERILQMEVVRMSDVYQEIMEEGRQEGVQRGRREGALRVIARLMTRKFAADIRNLDDLILRCTEDDLDWLVDEAMAVKQFATLRRHLEARLAGR